MRTGSRALAGLLLLVILAGWWTGKRAGGGGEAGWSPAERAVAQQALEVWRVEAGGGGPFPFLALSWQIDSIERRPGTCDTPVPGAFPSADLYDYQLRLRTYTFFGLPAGSVRFTCGGLAYRVE